MSAEDEKIEPTLRVLRYYPKAIAHLWRRHQVQRLTPVIGAGVSLDLGLPLWNGLVENIKNHPFVSYSGQVLSSDPAVATEQLYHYCFQSFRSQYSKDLGRSRTPEAEIVHRFKAKWTDTIRFCLYQGLESKDQELNNKLKSRQLDQRKVIETLEKKIKDHGYLEQLRVIIRNSPLTINYNFDDSLQRLIALGLTPEERQKEGRGYETFVTPNPNSQRNNCRIYHPNGFLPLSKLERASDSVSLSETELIGQTLSRHEVETVFLRSHLQTHTTLILGMSFSDLTQKRVYQEVRDRLPSNIHYLVQHLKETDDPKANFALRRNAMQIAEANFHAYRIFTIPLFDCEFKILLSLLNSSEEALQLLADRSRVQLSYRYYIVGVPGGGKSSVVENLGSLITHNEWPEEKPALLAKDVADLLPSEKIEVDEWIGKQFHLKNYRLENSKIGVHVIDRSPLDPLTFSNDCPTRLQRANELKRSLIRRVMPGHIIRLSAPLQELKLRLASQQKSISKRTLKHIADNTKKLYSSTNKKEITEIDTYGLPLKEVITLVSNVIHLAAADEFLLEDRLNEIINNRGEL